MELNVTKLMNAIFHINVKKFELLDTFLAVGNNKKYTPMIIYYTFYENFFSERNIQINYFTKFNGL